MSDCRRRCIVVHASRSRATGRDRVEAGLIRLRSASSGGSTRRGRRPRPGARGWLGAGGVTVRLSARARDGPRDGGPQIETLDHPGWISCTRRASRRSTPPDVAWARPRRRDVDARAARADERRVESGLMTPAEVREGPWRSGRGRPSTTGSTRREGRARSSLRRRAERSRRPRRRARRTNDAMTECDGHFKKCIAASG